MNRQQLQNRVDELIKQYQHDNPGTSYRRALLDLLAARNDDDSELNEIVNFFSKAKAEREAFQRRRGRGGEDK